MYICENCWEAEGVEKEFKHKTKNIKLVESLFKFIFKYNFKLQSFS